MSRPHDTRRHATWVAGVAFLELAAIAFLWMPHNDPIELAALDWADVVGEASLTLLAVGWLVSLVRSDVQDEIFVPFALGILALLGATTQDVLDEFFLTHHPSTSITENVAKFVGTALITVGLLRWQARQEGERELLERNTMRFARLSVTDALTGLFNRAYVNETLKRRLRASDELVSVIVLDIDDFKRVNDTHGHASGDDVLRALSEIMKDGVRQSDTVARMGGEEFVIVLPGAAGDVAREVADRIRTAFADAPTDFGESVTVSVGVAERVPTDTVESILARADEALYDVKRNGKNAVRLAPAPAPA